MKLIMFDWLCPVHGEFEELAKSDTKSLPCPQCSRTSNRQISAVRIDKSAMAFQEGASPTAIDHFERVHRERRAIEERTYKEHGDYGNHAGGDGGSPVSPESAAML
jgi:hypothetical protein